MGLGSARDLSLAAAREKARRERERLANGVDPLDLKRQDREAQREADAKRLSFRQAAERCHEAAAPGWSDPRTGDEFLGSLQRWVYPHIGSLDVAAIDKDAILKVLEQRLPDRMGRGEGGGTFWVKRSQTADRTRQRIERVLDWAEARGFRPSGRRIRQGGKTSSISYWPRRARSGRWRTLPRCLSPSFPSRWPRWRLIGTSQHNACDLSS
jgi:hypothetical protein